MDRHRRPDSVIRKHADGTYEVSTGPFEGRSEDRDHVEFSVARATGMDRSEARKLVNGLDSICDKGERAEITFHNRKDD